MPCARSRSTHASAWGCGRVTSSRSAMRLRLRRPGRRWRRRRAARRRRWRRALRRPHRRRTARCDLRRSSGRVGSSAWPSAAASCSVSPCQRACAASGMLQLPPRARDTARSACTASQVGRWIKAASALAQLGVVGAHLDAQRALAGGRQHLRRLEARADARRPGPGASARRRPARWRRTGLRRACAAACRGCRAAARCAGRAAAPANCTTRRRLEVPTHGALRQLGQAGVARRDEGVARVFALEHRGQREAGRQVHRHVLQRMHGQVGAALLRARFRAP